MPSGSKRDKERRADNKARAARKNSADAQWRNEKYEPDADTYRIVYECGACQLDQTDIACILGISDATFQRLKKRDADFAWSLEAGRSEFKKALRTAQIRTARRGNAAMLIWLGKQYLGQADKPGDTASAEELAAEIREYMEELELATVSGKVPLTQQSEIMQ